MCLAAMICAGASANAQSSIDWNKELKERITVNGYAQAGYTYTHVDGKNSNTFDVKRTLLWAKARITDRWSFLFMHDFNSQVQEFYTDYRISEGKELTIRFGQFKNQLSLENPLSPVVVELVDVLSQGATYLSGCGSDPLFGVNYGRDLGIDLFGELADGKLRYNLEVMNGRGINKKDLDNKKDIIVKLDFRPMDGLRFVTSAQKGYATAVATSIYDERYDSETDSYYTTIAVGETYRRDRWTVGAEYKSNGGQNDYWKDRCFTVRGEWLAGKDKENVSYGGYVTASAPLCGQWDWIASVDYFNYNKDVPEVDGGGVYNSEGNKDCWNLVAGVQYWFFRKCRVQLQYTFSDTWMYDDPTHRVQVQTQIAF